MNEDELLFFNNISGIYKITNPIGQIYIGQSATIGKRLNAYIGSRSKNKRGGKIKESLFKYGVRAHTFEIVHLCAPYHLDELEDYYVNFYKSFNTPQGLNCRTGGTIGTELIKESRSKITATRLKNNNKKKGRSKPYHFISTETKLRMAEQGRITRNRRKHIYAAIKNKPKLLFECEGRKEYYEKEYEERIDIPELLR